MAQAAGIRGAAHSTAGSDRLNTKKSRTRGHTTQSCVPPDFRSYSPILGPGAAPPAYSFACGQQHRQPQAGQGVTPQRQSHWWVTAPPAAQAHRRAAEEGKRQKRESGNPGRCPREPTGTRRLQAHAHPDMPPPLGGAGAGARDASRCRASRERHTARKCREHAASSRRLSPRLSTARVPATGSYGLISGSTGPPNSRS